jgi:hypothetical protein
MMREDGATCQLGQWVVGQQAAADLGMGLDDLIFFGSQFVWFVEDCVRYADFAEIMQKAA